MKKSLFAIGIGFLLAGSIIFTSCEGKEGPMGLTGPTGTNGTNGTNGKDGSNGVNGINGVNGVNGTNGKDANSSCLVCHTVANFDAKIAEYHLSKHYLGNTSARFTKFCARCHTHEGFQEVTGNGKFVVSNDIPNATRINCKTCHAHTGFDFSDTLAQVLSTVSPVYLNYNKNLTATDFGKINNLCTTCHQIRGATSLVYSDTTLNPDVINKAFDQLPYFPFVNTDDNASVSYLVGRSFAVHDGNQSNLFKGINGYEYAGKVYTRTWKHSDASCTDCHMNEFDAATGKGGHTLWVNDAACTACHNGADKITPVQALIDGKRIALAELLTARKVFKKTTNSSGVVSYSAQPTHDFNGKLYPTTQTAGDRFATSTSNNTVSPTTGLVIYGNMLKYAADADFTNRIGRQWKYGELGAAYNYAYINSELSMGAHNPTYALQLLQNSIDWLNANPGK